MSKELVCQRMKKMRQRMKEEKVDAYLVVTDDFHGSEYVGDYFKCREFLSGFDGSAGTLLITKENAGLWTDGRYFLQAESQLSGTGITLYKMGQENVPTIGEYLKEYLWDGSCLAYDGRTIGSAYAKKLKKELQDIDVQYRENEDFVDAVWQDRPPMSKEPVWELSITYAGKSRAEKINEIFQVMEQEGADYHLLSSLDDIAWLLNIRGNDVAYSPVVLSYVLMDRKLKQVRLYIERSVLDDDLRDALYGDGVYIFPYMQVYEDVSKLSEWGIANPTLMLDDNRVNVALVSGISSDVKVVNAENPTEYKKAVKNPVEMENERRAHIMDGVAVTKLVYWLKQICNTKEFETGEITELCVSEKLLELRKGCSDFIDQSFAPIIATGAHGAIVHYEATNETDIPIEKDTFLLMDTGGHYYQGTTDITRTVAIGTLDYEQKLHYTAVLRGNLNLAAASFKSGCTGANLDYLARNPLWELGLDYNHGTGHGVGYLLNVHEGPNAIRMKNTGGTVGVAFEEGMITSDEPGLYLENQYGIRLENLILCVNAKKTESGQFLKFETLTMVPFDKDAILAECMSDREKTLLNNYHKRVYETISPYLEEDERVWLREATAEIN